MVCQGLLCPFWGLIVVFFNMYGLMNISVITSCSVSFLSCVIQKVYV